MQRLNKDHGPAARFSSARFLARCSLGALFLPGSLVAWGQILALTDEEIFRNFTTGFMDAGSRSLGMAGAFTAVSNDASAVVHNPAGLWSVHTPELYLEYGWASSQPDPITSSQGSLQVNPVTGARDLPYLSLSSSGDYEQAGKPTLVSFSWPFALGKTGRHLTVAGSRTVSYSSKVDLPDSGSLTQAVFSFDSFPNTVNGSNVEAYSVSAPVTGSMDGEISSWNALVAVDLTKDFSLAVVLSQTSLDLQANTLTEVMDPQQILADPGHPRLPAQPTADIYQTSINDTASDFTYSIGLHLHPASVFAGGESPWLFGIAYHKGADLAVTETITLNQTAYSTIENRVIVPDRYSVGVTYSSNRHRWLVSADLERVDYSDMLAGYGAGVNYLTSPLLANGAFATNPNEPIVYTVDDGNTIRVGGEYRLRPHGSVDVALWAGYFHTPDSTIRLDQFNSTDSSVNATYRAAFPKGAAEDHFTGGVGVTWGGSTLRLAGETSDVDDRLWLSYSLKWRTP